VTDEGTTRLVWRAPPWRRWSYAAGALVALGLAITSDDRAIALGNGVAFIVVACVLLALVGTDLWFDPALVADQDGLGVRAGPGRIARIAWADIESIEASTTSRGPLRLSSLEIDLGDRLVVLSRHRLGADPEAVAVTLRRWWRSARRPR
jgi:hypothetical protein